ncbi:hypothetical protein BDK51DRAFT_37511 [Blyttiomyces helicus]|uniref:Uncharacterized protein n=1 Tax=Blyttiomyces helicus TaxID=388810 RepID=A0A4V1IQM0_9FUNG|nr:hypothetical protein BDK51DRAFT_37511 [Blyttiomyces helicus]|eukprot:RKO87027.1 hypothetical protein BDK51DRAFT_37511 [Blyttiomyces helicus]
MKTLDHDSDSNAGDTEDACPAQAAPSRPQRWAIDNYAAKDNDEAAHAILLLQDKNPWEDKAGDQNETRDADPTDDPDGTQGGADSNNEVGRTNVDRTQPPPTLCSQPGAGITLSLVADIPNVEKDLLEVVAVACRADEHKAEPDAWNSAPHGSALPRLHADLCSLKQISMGVTHKLVNFVYGKLPAPLPPVLMISLLDITHFWEPYPELSNRLRRSMIGVNAVWRLMGSDAKIVAMWWVSLWATNKEWEPQYRLSQSHVPRLHGHGSSRGTHPQPHAWDLLKDYGDIATVAGIRLSSDSPICDCPGLRLYDLLLMDMQRCKAEPPPTLGNGNYEPSEIASR